MTSFPRVLENAECSPETLWKSRLEREARLAERHRRFAPGTSMAPPSHPFVWAVSALLKGVGLYARGVRNANRPGLTHVTFHFDDLPPVFDGFHILHLSDFHFDGRPGHAESIRNLLDGVEADCCAITGDFMFDENADLEIVARETCKILDVIQSRHGTYAVLGNNDKSAIISALRPHGVEFLVNRGVPITRNGAMLWLMGVDDPHGYKTNNLTAALDGMPSGAVPILLAHTPEIAREAARKGVALYLCGHTHGGQLCLPLFGAPKLNIRCSIKFAEGHWRHGGLHGYTTRGLGCTAVPVRYNCPPEAAIIELRQAGRYSHGAWS